MDIAFSAFIFIFFACNMYSFNDNVLRISVLKLSSKFQISTFVTPPPDALRVWIPCLCLIAPRGHFMHNSQMASNSSYGLSPLPTTFNSSKDSPIND